MKCKLIKTVLLTSVALGIAAFSASRADAGCLPIPGGPQYTAFTIGNANGLFGVRVYVPGDSAVIPFSSPNFDAYFTAVMLAVKENYRIQIFKDSVSGELCLMDVGAVW